MLPALSGTLILAGWLFTRSGSFEVLGLLNIVLGLVAAVIGAAALITHFARSRGDPHHPTRRRRLLLGVLAAAILIGNFPLAGFYVWVADLYFVRVVNATPRPVTNFVVTDPRGRTWQFGPIPPGGSTRRGLNLKGEGAVVFSATANGRQVTGEIDGYITSSMESGSRTVTFHANGTITVK